MAGSQARVTRWSRRSVLAGTGFLVLWSATVLAVGPGSGALSFGLLGFVFHVVFGKAYALVPSYFARTLTPTVAPAVQLPLTATGTVALGASWLLPTPPAVRLLGAASWALGLGVFVGSLAWSLRGNLSGRETGTGEANAHRRGLDRFANAFVPVAVGYMLVGSYELLAGVGPVPTLLDGYLPRAVHLLGAGGATLLVFAVGFRLLPRFFVSTTPRWLPGLVLPAGSLGPALLAASLTGGGALALGGLLEATAAAGFAVAVVVLFRRSNRRRVGLYGALAGVLCLLGAAGLGLQFAFGERSVAAVTAHRRLNLLGFLGTTIVGLTYQFNPPAVARLPGADDRTAGFVLASIVGGVGIEVGGLLGGLPPLAVAGRTLALLGSLGHLYVYVGVLRRQ
jgi:hypothetical protein